MSRPPDPARMAVPMRPGVVVALPSGVMDAILQGRDFALMGEVHVVAPAADLALAITRGIHPKPYDYVDPNEDVVAVVREGTVTALVVADGHNGLEGSHALVDGILDALPQPLPPSLGRRGAVEAFHRANQHLRGVRRTLSGPNRYTRSTLTVALVDVAADGSRQLQIAGVGDSAVIVSGPASAAQLSRDHHRFLGEALSLPEIAGCLDYSEHTLGADETLIVVTDGFTNFASVHDVPDLLDPDPSVAGRNLIDLAARGGAGDNIAVAVLAAPASTNADRSPHGQH